MNVDLGTIEIVLILVALSVVTMILVRLLVYIRREAARVDHLQKQLSLLNQREKK